MKLWTINTHSLLENDYEQKFADFVDAVIQEKPDIIAMQEVNQLHTSDDVTINEDNHAYRAAKLLEERGIQYYWKWLPVKIGYGKYDEGLAIMSLSPITDTDKFLMHNWTITASLTEDGTLRYENGKHIVTETDDKGKDSVLSETTDESGAFYLNDAGELIWHDDKAERDGDSTFIK